jgi:hypothetical protein
MFDVFSLLYAFQGDQERHNRTPESVQQWSKVKRSVKRGQTQRGMKNCRNRPLSPFAACLFETWQKNRRVGQSHFQAISVALLATGTSDLADFTFHAMDSTDMEAIWSL